MNKILLAISVIPLFFGAVINHQNEIINYYGIPTTIKFNNIDYEICWSSHPNDSYYKQEYIPHNEKADHFNDMVLLDFLNSEVSAQQTAQAQTEILTERKKTDRVCNYQLIKNEKSGEYILDFLMSESKSNSITIIEWNVYHYKEYTDKSGHKGVILFGVSHRAYDENAMDFLKSLRTYRQDILRKMSVFPVPEIQLKN